MITECSEKCNSGFSETPDSVSYSKAWLASNADILWACNVLLVDSVTSPKNVCIGG